MNKQIKFPSIPLNYFDEDSSPTVEFTSGDTKLNLVLGTGVEYSTLYSKIPGKIIGHKTNKFTEISNPWGGDSAKYSLIEVELLNNGYKFIAEMIPIKETEGPDSEIVSGFPIHGVLGIDFLRKYGFVIDFYNNIAYPILA